jgi:hypothetical protein
MQLAFFRGDDIVDLAIKLWTRGEFCHAEIVFRDGKYFSSTFKDNVRWRRDNDPIIEGKWVYINIPMTAAEEEIVRVFCEGQIGKKYDICGALGIALPLHQHKKQWFCSEILVAALQKVGRFQHIKPHRVDPWRLYKIVTGDVSYKRNK